MARRRDPTQPTLPTIKRLFAHSGNRCAFPRCTATLIDGSTVVGEVCHIKGARPGSARYDAQQSPVERHGFDNLILMCSPHHKVIDDKENKKAYPVERLLKIKADHQSRAACIDDSFAERAAHLLIDESATSVNQSGGITAHTVRANTINFYLSEAAKTDRPLRKSPPESTASPLLIIFDHRNPNRKFWSIEPMRDETGNQTQGSYWEYRAIVKNSSASTVRNVRVLVEATGPLPTRPEQSVFDIDRKPVRDLAPEEEALAVIRAWYNPPRVEGLVCGDDVYGPIKMIAYGDDVQPRTKLFHFNPERTPMIWEFGSLEEREATVTAEDGKSEAPLANASADRAAHRLKSLGELLQHLCDAQEWFQTAVRRGRRESDPPMEECARRCLKAAALAQRMTSGSGKLLIPPALIKDCNLFFSALDRGLLAFELFLNPSTPGGQQMAGCWDAASEIAYTELPVIMQHIEETAYAFHWKDGESAHAG
jgi:hypothetical protein